ncbi:MAG TPA: HD domain-containing phosphohydrolase [Bacillota bacterium]|nr:HD domain-containing phosphohydrolase [Bacillota bacterium]
MARVLLVDDDPAALRLLQAFLAPDGYEFAMASDGEEALQNVAEERPDLILLDLNLPRLDGFGVLERLRADEWTALVPVAVITAADDRERRLHAVELGAADFLTKPVDRSELRLRVKSWLGWKRHVDEIGRLHSTLQAFARAVEARDPTRGDHCERLAVLTARVGQRLGLGDSDLRALQVAAFLHDIGQVALPDAVVLKPGPLHAQEVAMVRTHPVAGDQLLRSLGSLDDARRLVRHHHERLDGSGYPDGLTGEQISLPVRILSVADVFDALTHDRPYRRAMPMPQALRVLEAEAGRGFWDPEVVRAVKEVFGS